MKLLCAIQELRESLNARPQLSDDEHRAALLAAGRRHPHSVRFVAARRDETCVPYSLMLTDQPTYRAIATFVGLFAGKEFMEWALHNHLTELGGPHVGCLACYFDGDAWRHVGTVTAMDRVISKWGTWPLYEHGFAEVPTEYGDRIKFYERPSISEAMVLFLAFANCKGADGDIIEAAMERHRSSVDW